MTHDRAQWSWMYFLYPVPNQLSRFYLLLDIERITKALKECFGSMAKCLTNSLSAPRKVHGEAEG